MAFDTPTANSPADNPAPTADASQPAPQVAPTPAPQPTPAASGPATAPASALPPSKSNQVHGVLGGVLMGALAGAAQKVTQGARKVGPAVKTGLKNFAMNSPRGQELQKNALERQTAQQKMQLDQQREGREQTKSADEHGAAMDEHTLHQIEYNNATLTNHGLFLKAQQEDQAVADAQDDLAAAFAKTMKDNGIEIDVSHGPGHSGLVTQDATDAAQGNTVHLFNGETGANAGVGIANTKDFAQPLQHDVQMPTTMSIDPATGKLVSGDVQTIKADGRTTMGDVFKTFSHVQRIGAKAQADFDQQQKNIKTAADSSKAVKEVNAPPLAPKSLGEATASYTQTMQAYRANPTEANKLALTNATEMRKNFFSDEATKSRLDEQAKEGDPTAISQMLVDGIVAPSMLPGRFRPEYISAVFAKAQQLAKAEGKPFNPEKAESEYQYAKSPTTQNTLNMISSMEEPGGSIDIAQTAALSLPALDQKTANKVFNATATEFGSPEATKFHTAMLGLADEYAKVMGGGVASDTGRQQALDILQQDYSKGQLRGGIDILRQDIRARQRAIIRDNPALKAMYPDLDAPHNGGEGVPVPAGKVPAYSKSTGQVIGYADDANGTNFVRTGK